MLNISKEINSLLFTIMYNILMIFYLQMCMEYFNAKTQYLVKWWNNIFLKVPKNKKRVYISLKNVKN